MFNSTKEEELWDQGVAHWQSIYSAYLRSCTQSQSQYTHTLTLMHTYTGGAQSDNVNNYYFNN